MAAAGHAQSLKLMTYNIRLDVASDGENAWTHRRDFLSDQILFYSPDIFGIQEGLPHQVEYLQQKCTTYASVGIGREGAGKGESTHIFYDRNRFTLKENHTFWLSTTPDTVSMGWDAACLRVCTAVLLKEKKSKKQFWVFNTHLDHVGETARQNAVDLILLKMTYYNKSKLPVFFMGDLNAEPASVVVSKLKKEMLDCREHSEMPAFGPSGTFNGFKFDAPVTRLIDYIFISRDTKIRIKKYAVLSDSQNLRYPSDHLPVFVELSLRP